MTLLKLLLKDECLSGLAGPLSFQNHLLDPSEILTNIKLCMKSLIDGDGSISIFEDWNDRQLSHSMDHWGYKIGTSNPVFCSNAISTSATTGYPKICVYNQDALINIQNVGYKEDFSDRKIYSSLSLAHSYMFPGTLVPALGLAKKIVLDRTQNPLTFKPIIEREEIDMVVTVPGQLRFWTKFSIIFKNIKIVYSAGGPFPWDILETVWKMFPNAIIINNYGATECGPRIGRSQITKGNAQQDFFELVSGQKLRVSGKHAYLSSNRLMTCYLSDDKPAKSEFKLQDKIEVLDSGFIVKGRIDDVFNLGGKKVSKKYLKLVFESILDVGDFLIDEKNLRIVLYNLDSHGFLVAQAKLAETLNIEHSYIIHDINSIPRIEK